MVGVRRPTGATGRGRPGARNERPAGSGTTSIFSAAAAAAWWCSAARYAGVHAGAGTSGHTSAGAGEASHRGRRAHAAAEAHSQEVALPA